MKFWNRAVDLRLPLVWAVLALLLSPVGQLATGQPIAYTIAPGLIALVAWRVERLTRRNAGLTFGNGFGLAVGILAPLASMLLVGFFAWLADDWNPAAIPAASIAQMAAMSFVVTLVLAFLTEEGLFRGVLWGSCLRAGLSPWRTLAFTAVAFGAWHIAAALIIPDFELPSTLLPIYTGNMLLIGLMFGLARMASGSLLMPSLAHAAWNTAAYGAFGHGADRGLLGISGYGVFDPERGWVGLIVNAVVVLAFAAWIVRRQRSVQSSGVRFA